MLGTNHVLHQGRYRIINSLDQNDWGAMYEAYDTVSHTNVVLSESVGLVGKVATPSQLKAIHEAFAGSAKALTEIEHESLVSVQDYFSEIDRQYLVLESVTGSDLTRYLDESEAKPALTDVLSWIDQVLNALNYLHKLSPPVIHRDIRPANIKLTSSLKVKLLTARINASAGNDLKAVPGRDGDGNATNYRPLEQLWNDLDRTSQRVVLNSYDEKAAGVLLRPLDPRSDLYSVAASFYHILTRTVPPDAYERSITILDGKPDPLAKPHEIDDSIPPEVSDALMRSLAIRRENRFESAAIMAQVLRTAIVRAHEREDSAAETSLPVDLPTDILEITDDRPAAVVATPPAVAAIEAQLEREQTLAEERQREIEAEQARLDEERERLEQRRLELEAEKEHQAAERERLRLEAQRARERAEEERRRLEKEKLEHEAEKERQRIAERLALLEAERDRERAEEERLEKEAEAERQRAEQRVQELHAEQERHRAEQKRIEEEAKEELERAERRLMELSGADLDISEPSGEPTTPREEESERTSLLSTASHLDEIPVPDFAGRSRSNWRLPVGITATLLVGAVLFWMFMPTTGPAPAPVVQQRPAVVEESAAVPEPTPQSDQALSEDQPEATGLPVESEVGETPTRQQMSAGRSKQKRPAAAKTPKKVTVEDLINDK